MDLGGGEDINTERDVTSVRMIPSLMNRGPPDDEDHDGDSSPEDVEVQEDGNIGDKPKSDPEDAVDRDPKGPTALGGGIDAQRQASITVVYCKTSAQIADIFTKCLGPVIFERLWKVATGYQPASTLLDLI